MPISIDAEEVGVCSLGNSKPCERRAVDLGGRVCQHRHRQIAIDRSVQKHGEIVRIFLRVFLGLTRRTAQKLGDDEPTLTSAARGRSGHSVDDKCRAREGHIHQVELLVLDRLEVALNDLALVERRLCRQLWVLARDSFHAWQTSAARR
jgi:hypothetical protein